MEILKLSVQGMTCNHCVRAINNALKETGGIGEVLVNLQENRVEVQFEPENIHPTKIISIIEEEGYQVLE